MDLYTATILMIVITMFNLIVSIYISSAYTRQKKLLSILMSCLVMVCALCEWAGVKFDKAQTNKALHIFVKLLELSLAPLAGLLPGFILSSKGDIKFGKIEIGLLSLMCLNLVLEIVSAFTGFIYDVDDISHYTHGPCYFIYLLTYAIAFVYFIYSTFKVFRSRNVRYLIPILLDALFVIFGIILQMVTSDIKLDWLAISISLVLMFKFYGDVLANTDSLTSLLNRNDFDNTIKNLSSDVVVIYFDVNCFKQINDNYGHLYGDECLIRIANCLKKAYAKYGRVYRYGGDEFCVILSYKLDRVDSLNEKFNEYIKEEISKDSKFPQVSLGYATYKPEIDQIIDVLDKADQEMYKNKIESKNVIKQ